MSMAAWAPVDLSLHRGKSKREERTPVKLRTTRYTKRHFAFAPFLQTGKDWVTGIVSSFIRKKSFIFGARREGEGMCSEAAAATAVVETHCNLRYIWQETYIV